MCTIRSRNQRTDQGSLDPGSVCTNLLACCLVHQAVEVTSEVARGDMSGFRALMNVERVGWTASSWAMPSQGPTDPRVAPTRRSLAGKDTLGVHVDSGTWPESDSPGSPEEDPASLRPQRDPMVPRLPPCGATRSGPHGIWPLGVGVAETRPLFVLS